MIRRLRLAGALLIAGALAACDGSPSLGPAGTSYLLVSANGQPVPFAMDSIMQPDGRSFVRRITYRSLDFISADSVVYGAVSDAYTRGTPPGGFGWDCAVRRAAYRVEGRRVIVEYSHGPYVGTANPSLATEDTLEIVGEGLSHALREPPTIPHPGGRTFQLRYEPRESVAGCSDMPESYPPSAFRAR